MMTDYKEYLILTDSLTHDEVIQVPVLDEDGNPVYDEDSNPAMEDKVIQVPNYPSEDFRAVVDAGMHGERFLVMATHTENPMLPGDTLVYGFNPYTGEKTEPFDEALYTEIRPLGNSPDGLATGYLGFDTWAGAAPRLCGEEASPNAMSQFYPGVPPFEIIVEHYWYDQAEFSGFGFLAEITGQPDLYPAQHSGVRDPANRAMAVYSDPECAEYLWTGGAYQLGPSRLGQLNSEGYPLTVWFSDTPPGQRTAVPREWHLACLFGAVQEGHATLEVGGNLLLQFWDHNQATPPGGSEWVDTGATVIAQAGTLYRISDIDVAASLTTGQQIRFGDTAETTFTGTWAGGGDYLEIDPFVQATVGDALWSFE